MVQLFINILDIFYTQIFFILLYLYLVVNFWITIKRLFYSNYTVTIIQNKSFIGYRVIKKFKLTILTTQDFSNCCTYNAPISGMPYLQYLGLDGG